MIKKYELPKLALELIGYLITSTVIAAFSFCFLYYTSIALADKNISNGVYDSYVMSDPQFLYWLQLICIIAALVIFFTFFLLFLGQKISYILSITTAIQKLKDGNLSHKIDTIGDDELTVLADTINSFAIALKTHVENEDRLKKEKEDLIRSLSHDIRTPLTAIISYTDFIKDNRYDSDEKLDSYIEIIQSKAHQIQDLTSLLLNSNSIHNNSFEHKSLDGKLMFEQFISELVDSLEDNDFNVLVDTLGLASFSTNFNPQDIARIFDNLYSNILKYADNQHNISLKVSMVQGNLIILQTNTIKDIRNTNVESNGIGVKNINQIVNHYNGHMNYEITNKIYKIEITIPINL